MPPATAPPAPAKKPGSRTSTRVQSMRACANPSAVRKVVTVFNTRDDATFTGTDDMIVLARLTARVKALVPAAHLVDNSIVPMRTRGKSPQNLGFLNVTLQGKDGMELQAVLNSLLQFSEKFTRLASIDSFPAGAAISIVVSEEARVGPLAKYLVIQAEATALAYSSGAAAHWLQALRARSAGSKSLMFAGLVFGLRSELDRDCGLF